MDAALPEVVLMTTASVDARITLGRHQRLLDAAVAERWAWIQVHEAFATRHQEYDSHVVLEGSGSFVDVDTEPPHWPAPTTPDVQLWADHLPHRASNWFVVADGRGRVDWRFTGDATTRLHVLVCQATPPGYLQRLRDLDVGYFVVGGARVDLRAALTRIRRVLKAPQVIANSGGTLSASLLRAGLVDVVDVVTLPGLVGGAGTPSIMDGPPLEPDERPIRLQLLDCRVERGAIRSRYRVEHPRPTWRHHRARLAHRTMLLCGMSGRGAGGSGTLTFMDVRGVDPRDQTWELGLPSYRVYFHGANGSQDEYELRDADVVEVLA